MSTRANRSRCYVCRTVPKFIIAKLVQWSPSQGWHTTVPLCQPCIRRVMEAVTALSQVPA